MLFPEITYKHCPCCGATAVEFRLSAKDYVATGEVFEIWECLACTVRFTQHIPGIAAIGRYYDSEDYMSHSVNTSGWFNKLYQTARRYSVRWRYQTVKKSVVSTTNSLLDIGTGTGAFPYYMKSKGWKVTALEPDEDSRKTALQQYRMEVHPMEEINNLSSQSFEVITLWHVLEHVHNLHFYLQQIQRILTNTGSLLIAVPNYKSNDARRYNIYWDAYDVPRHLYHFSPVALETLLAKYGFTLSGRKTFWLDPFYVCLRSERHKTGEQKLVAATKNGLISCLTGMMKIEKASAITYIFKKQNPF